tara:strand:- start:10579 stop:10926 length:348 start_codon:yes stop_codon:yes gene_type:complete
MQLLIDFDASLVTSYGSCREFIAARVHQLGRPQKSIAADMDYSPSDLSRKLAQNPDDSRRFTLDDLEKYIQVTKDIEPVKYLAEKYLADKVDEIQKLKDQIAFLEQQKNVKSLRA